MYAKVLRNSERLSSLFHSAKMSGRWTIKKPGETACHLGHHANTPAKDTRGERILLVLDDRTAYLLSDFLFESQVFH
jgi:hypothetical protein